MTDLQRLIRQQALDDAGRYHKRSRREALATDLGPDGEGWVILDGQAGRPRRREDSTGRTVYLQGCTPWEAWQHPADGPDVRPAIAAKVESATLRGEPITLNPDCPLCKGVPGRFDHYCLRCDRAGKDGKVKYKGSPVGEICRTAYVPDPSGRKGGVG